MFWLKHWKTQLELVQNHALSSWFSVRHREIHYGIWKILDQADIKNDQPLQPCPSGAVLQAELDRAHEELDEAYFYENGWNEYEYDNAGENWIWFRICFLLYYVTAGENWKIPWVFLFFKACWSCCAMLSIFLILTCWNINIIIKLCIFSKMKYVWNFNFKKQNYECNT